MSASNPPARRITLPEDYDETLARLATEVRAANVRATLHVNRELITLYWNIGREVSASRGLLG